MSTALLDPRMVAEAGAERRWPEHDAATERERGATAFARPSLDEWLGALVVDLERGRATSCVVCGDPAGVCALAGSVLEARCEHCGSTLC